MSRNSSANNEHVAKTFRSALLTRWQGFSDSEHQDQEPEKMFLLKHVFLSKCFRLIFDTLQPEGWGPHSRFQSKLFGSQQNRHLGRILPATTKVMAHVWILDFVEHDEEERNLSKVSLWKEQRWYAHRLSCDIDHYILQQNIKYPQLKITLTVNKIIFSI